MAERDLQRRKLSKFAIGDMRDRIRLERRETIPANYDDPEPTEQYTLIASVWAKVDTPRLNSVAGGGDLSYNNVNLQTQNSYRFTIRYRAGLNAFDTVIRWENQLFKIINTGMISPQRRGQYLVIPAELAGSDSLEANQ